MKLKKQYPPTALKAEQHEVRRCTCQRSTACTMTGATMCRGCQCYSGELVGVGQERGHGQQPARLLPPAAAH